MVRKSASGGELHDQEWASSGELSGGGYLRLFADLAVVVEQDNCAVVEACYRPGFGTETLNQERSPKVGSGQHLHRDGDFGLAVYAPPDLGHSTLAYRMQEVELA